MFRLAWLPFSLSKMINRYMYVCAALLHPLLKIGAFDIMSSLYVLFSQMYYVACDALASFLS